MSLKTAAKPKQFALTLTEDELLMLKDLADESSDSAAGTVRAFIRGAYAKKFKFKIAGAKIMPTIRAIIDDIAGPVHYTGGNIASRTMLPLELVTHVLEELEKRGVVECVDHNGGAHNSQNWTWELLVPRDRAFAAIAKAGYDPDADLTPKN